MQERDKRHQALRHRFTGPTVVFQPTVLLRTAMQRGVLFPRSICFPHPVFLARLV